MKRALKFVGAGYVAWAGYLCGVPLAYAAALAVFLGALALWADSTASA